MPAAREAGMKSRRHESSSLGQQARHGWLAARSFDLQERMQYLSLEDIFKQCRHCRRQKKNLIVVFSPPINNQIGR
jgi:hypothetical protein